MSFLPLALVGVLIQTGAEEVLFRGYMQQQLAARFSSPILWMVLPSAIFAALHYQPEIMGDNTWLMMGAVFVFACWRPT
jgi:membrane protease YdiL (CAAX protease family)